MKKDFNILGHKVKIHPNKRKVTSVYIDKLVERSDVNQYAIKELDEAFIQNALKKKP